MIIGVKHTITLLKNLFLEIFLNKTDKVTDVSDNSVLNATAFGVAKVGQKCLKDISIVAARIFPSEASGENLDYAAALFGVSARKTAIGSTTYLRVIAMYEPDNAEQRTYPLGTVFINTNGVRFISEEEVTVGSNGYAYIKVRSESVGSQTNVEPNTIISVVTPPEAHVACTNEYYAIGGRDEESDEIFRQRILNNTNLLSIGTEEYFTQIFQEIDSRILKVWNYGVDENSYMTLALATQNGVQFTETELDQLLTAASPYFPLSDKNQYGNVIGIQLKNIDWYIVGGEIDENGNGGVQITLTIDSSYNSDEVRRNIQIALSKHLDFRTWEPGSRVEWDDLLSIVKNVDGVKYVDDQKFQPHNDIAVPDKQLPRIKSFILKNLDGSVIFDNSGVLSPIFYPSEYAPENR